MAIFSHENVTTIKIPTGEAICKICQCGNIGESDLGGIAESESDARSGFQGVGQHCLSIYKPSFTLNFDIFNPKVGICVAFSFLPQKKRVLSSS